LPRPAERFTENTKSLRHPRTIHNTQPLPTGSRNSPGSVTRLLPHVQYGICSIALRYANVYELRQDPHAEAKLVTISCEKLAAE
jgi:hypothetical protein